MAALLIHQHPEPTLDGVVQRDVNPKINQLVTGGSGAYYVTGLTDSSKIYIDGKPGEAKDLKKGQAVEIWSKRNGDAILILSSKRDCR